MEVEKKISGITEAEERQSRGIAERPQDGRWDTLVHTRLDRGHIAMHLSDYLGLLENRAY